MSMPTNLLIEIQQRLPVHLAKQVLVSLRQDELVWSELQREDLFKSLPIYQDQNIIVWSPGAFALQVLGFPMSLDELADPSYVPLEKHWCERCLSTYERTLRAIVPPASLGEAGLLALALRERRRLIRSWAGLAQELSKNLSGDPLPISIWKPVLSCLYRYVSDPLDIFKSLLAEWKGLDVYALVSHALLSNPMTYEEKVRIFRKLLEELSEGQQLEWLRYLRLRKQQSKMKKYKMNFCQKMLSVGCPKNDAFITSIVFLGSQHLQYLHCKEYRQYYNPGTMVFKLL